MSRRASSSRTTVCPTPTSSGTAPNFSSATATTRESWPYRAKTPSERNLSTNEPVTASFVSRQSGAGRRGVPHGHTTTRTFKLWEDLRSDPESISSLWPERVERDWWVHTLERLRTRDEPDTWDYRWMFTIIARGAMCALPRVNLVTNVGFRLDATHTFPSLIGKKHHRDSVSAGPILPLCHPNTIERDLRAEGRLFDYAHGGRAARSRIRRSLRLIWSAIPSHTRAAIRTWLAGRR